LGLRRGRVTHLALGVARRVRRALVDEQSRRPFRSSCCCPRRPTASRRSRSHRGVWRRTPACARFPIQ